MDETIEEESGRTCVVCRTLLPKSKRKDAIYCSEKCGNRKRSREWEILNPQKVLASRGMQNQKTATRMYQRVKSRAKLTGVEFSLDIEDIIIPVICPVLNITLVLNNRGKGGYYANSPSLDRIEPSLGYVKGNIRVISCRANLLKNNATVDELTAVLEDLKSLRETVTVETTKT